MISPGIRQFLNVGFGMTRVLFGVVASSVPEKVGSTWIGEDASRESSKVVFRALGLRDIALGAGMVEASVRDEAAPWLAVAMLSDLGDFTATVIARNKIDPRAVAITAFLTGSATLTAAGLLALNLASD
jgi:hypothetical protein